MSSVPIAEHALLSDRHSAALVTSGGSVDWLCFPRFDSASVFAAILDDNAGHWSIHPVGAFTSTRSYIEATMVLRTTFDTAQGSLELLDAMDLGDPTDPHRLGENAPHTLLRGLRCTRGHVTVEISFAPRPEYGLVVPVTTSIDGGVRAVGGPDRFTLTSPVPLHCTDGTGSARVELEAGQRLYFALHRTRLGAPVTDPMPMPDVVNALARTIEGWRAWSRLHQSYDGPWCELVHHSGRVLQALSYQPTGAIIAAATTSLPEQIGGQRNWDYRYSWVRDASFTMQALWVAACPDEADEFFGFMTAAAAHAHPDRPLQIMFGIGGEHDLSERELTHLSGWRGSAPVRVGNGAWAQPQLDVYGELLDAAALMIPIVGFLPAADPRVQSTIDAVATRLTDGRGLVYRYHTAAGVDGLDGEEGTFLLCTFWLARALAMAGRTGEAREVFERAAGHVNDVGLLAEEIDPITGEQLGNTPQAFSHIGLVNAAWSIHQAEQQARRQIDPGGEVGVNFPAARSPQCAHPGKKSSPWSPRSRCPPCRR